MKNNRYYGEEVEISESSVKQFFNKRGNKWDKTEERRYNITMYQDNNPGLALERDHEEKKKITSILRFTNNDSVIDIGCGVGRWADELADVVKSYTGIDFSDVLVKIANERYQLTSNVNFYEGKFQDVLEVIKSNNLQQEYDYVFVNGVFVYINNIDVDKCMDNIKKITKKGSRIYIKESIAVDKKLILKDFHSDELKCEYNAIYRNLKEWGEIFSRHLPQSEYVMLSSGYIFPETNNRTETNHYYWIFEKK